MKPHIVTSLIGNRVAARDSMLGRAGLPLPARPGVENSKTFNRQLTGALAVYRAAKWRRAPSCRESRRGREHHPSRELDTAFTRLGPVSIELTFEYPGCAGTYARIQESGATMNQQPHSSATTVLNKAEKLEQLRRKMASIPARSDGTEPATPSVMLKPVGEREPTPIVATAQSTLRMLPVPPPLGELLPAEDSHEAPSSASPERTPSSSDCSHPSPQPVGTQQ